MIISTSSSQFRYHPCHDAFHTPIHCHHTFVINNNHHHYHYLYHQQRFHRHHKLSFTINITIKRQSDYHHYPHILNIYFFSSRGEFFVFPIEGGPPVAEPRIWARKVFVIILSHLCQHDQHEDGLRDNGP